jgi:hypothetical protein
MVMATMWAMAMAARLGGKEEGKSDGSKGKCDCDDGGGHQRGQGQQGDGNCDKGGEQADNGCNDEGDGEKDKEGR